MKTYEELNENLQERLEEIVSSDPYGLSPRTLYKNIYLTSLSSTIENTAKIFEVNEHIVHLIINENQK